MDTQFCDICNEDHPVEEFEMTAGGWHIINDIHHNWFTLKCLRTDQTFTVTYTESITLDDGL